MRPNDRRGGLPRRSVGRFSLSTGEESIVPTTDDVKGATGEGLRCDDSIATGHALAKQALPVEKDRKFERPDYVQSLAARPGKNSNLPREEIMNVLLHALRVSAACLVVSLPLVIFAGCEPSDDEVRCGLVWCTDRVRLDFPENIPEEGEWRFRITVDERAATCTVTLPERGLERGSCDEPQFDITYKSASGGGDLFPSGIRVPGNPTTVVVTVEAPSRASFIQSLQPSYKEFAPNGRECGPICMEGSGTLVLMP